nr:MAG TPA: hypothetical protein [Bacteriophage sp.]
MFYKITYSFNHILPFHNPRLPFSITKSSNTEMNYFRFIYL